MGEKYSIAEILQQEFEKRSDITNINMSAEKLFQLDDLRKWTTNLLENDGTSELNRRIQSASEERLSHAAATYLLGIAVREGLNLNFDSLPRIFSKGSYGDAFYFYWSVICLCHDLGYQYETNDCDLGLMDQHEGRCKLLEIEYDLFEVKKDLDKFGGTAEENEWIIETVDLVEKYDRMRRSKEDYVGDKPQIDHGIAGALILYDFLMKEYDRTVEQRKQQLSGNRYRDVRLAEQQEIVAGEVSTNLYHKRFPICAILIACTVARHNMWTASDAEDVDRYRRYDLDFLCQSKPIVGIESSLTQMLFMLDFMDTIDPVKALYTRKAEKGGSYQELQDRQRFLLNGITIQFRNTDGHQYRWGNTLRYQEFTIAVKPTENSQDKQNFAGYAEGLLQLHTWLNTKAPCVHRDSENRVTDVTFYYPNIPKKQRHWVGGITEDEITSLCLYEGSGGNGNSNPFYKYHNAYQTLNLIMMDGLDGEQARICEEHQNPIGIYIKQWKKTLEVMTDIFTAQCKFMEYWYKEKGGQPAIYRVDRAVNFHMMQEQNRTFALTSTSKKGYLEHIEQNKKNVILEEIVLIKNVPFVDYAELLQEQYVYSEEEEVLLPPFVDLIKAEEYPHAVSHYVIKFGGFRASGEREDETVLIDRLEKNKGVAVQFLENIKKTKTIDRDSEQARQYMGWKKDFQTLVRQCFCNIGKAYGLEGDV